VFSLLLNRLVYAPFAQRGVGLFGMVIVTISVQLAIGRVYPGRMIRLSHRL